MTDHELDRVLAGAVNVEHSPEFLAHVRQRVAVEHMRPWLFQWRYAVASAAVVGVFALALSWRAGEETTPAPGVIATRLERSLVPPPAAEVITRTEPAVVERASRRKPSVSRRARPVSQDPEVIIARDDARAIQLLAAAATESRIPARLQADGVSTRVSVTLPGIEIPRLVVEPLAEIARLEGDRP